MTFLRKTRRRCLFGLCLMKAIAFVYFVLYWSYDQFKTPLDGQMKIFDFPISTGPIAETLYHRHDFLKDEIFQFDQRFKNPCWYDGETLRCLPYFFIIGFRKCGTTSLFKIIEKHPDVTGWGSLDVVPWGTKEAQFFGNGQKRHANGSDDINTYVDMFEKASRTIQRSLYSNEGKMKASKYIFGDASVCTLYTNYAWRYYPGNENRTEPAIVSLDYVHHFLPNAKLILIVRDPVERLYSEFYFAYGKLHPGIITKLTPETFHTFVMERVETYKQCLKTRTVRQCVYNSSLTQEKDLVYLNLQLGIYYIYWMELIRVYKREQILVVRMEDLGEMATLRDVYNFLELSELPDKQMYSMLNSKTANPRLNKYIQQGPMLNTTREMLRDFYRPFNERMARLTGDTYFLFNV